MGVCLLAYLVANDLLPRVQSAYRKRHSTETALLRVWSDILTAADQRQVTLLGLLDMSAAFDCVDHDLLLQRLQLWFGLIGVVLEWIRSFLRVAVIRRPTRIRVGSAVVRFVHSRTE